MSQMLKSSGAMGLATLSSRLLGLVREMVYAHFMGDSNVASAFKLAFQVPNLFRRLLGEGALTAAFIPIFKETERRAGAAEMWAAANAVISGLILAVSALVAVVVTGVSLVLALSPVTLTPQGAVFTGLGGLTPDTRLMLELLRAMFPYLLLVCLAAIFMAMLNARGYFFIPAMGATTLNVAMIATVLFLAPHFGQTREERVFALAVGVLLAGVAQAGFQLPTLRREGYRFRWINPWGNPVVREVVRKMIPGVIGVAAFQLNVLLIMNVSFHVDRRIVASFDYAVRLMEFPQGIFGVSLATYLLPTLAGLAAEKKYPEFRATLRQGLGYLMFVNLLASMLLVVLAEPMVRLLFERGDFNAGSTHRASLALACLAPGLVAFSAVNILARAFYALGDTQTPMKISLVCLGLNLVCALWLVGPYKQAGLGAANTLSSAVNVWLLLHALRRKLKRLDFHGLGTGLVSMLAATALAGLVAGLAWQAWAGKIGHASFLTKAGELFVPMTLAAASYWAVNWALRVPQAKELLDLILRRARPS